MPEIPPLLEGDAEAAREPFVLGVEERPPATHGDAENAAWFTARLQEVGSTQGSFARFMLCRGGTRPKRSARRSIRRMCAGQARAAGEMRVLLGLRLRSKQRTMARAARERGERNAPWNDSPETHREQGSREAREPPSDHSSETRTDQGGWDAREASGADPSGARGGPEEPGERGAPLTVCPKRAGDSESRTPDAPSGDLSETRSGPGKPDARGAPPDGSSEARRGPGEPDTRGVPGADPAEARHDRRNRTGAVHPWAIRPKRAARGRPTAKR